MTKQKKEEKRKNKKLVFLIILLLLNINDYTYADSNNCKELKKFSVEYFKCKGNIIKDKTISTGKNIIKDTKNFQNEEWIEEKEKIDNVKDKINKTKDKVLNK